jgi:hypothetical protein
VAVLSRGWWQNWRERHRNYLADKASASASAGATVSPLVWKSTAVPRGPIWVELLAM